MTEAQWLTCKDARKMADAAVGSPRAGERTFRLTVAAFWGWQALRLPDGQRADLERRVTAMGHWADAGRLPPGVRIHPRWRPLNPLTHTATDATAAQSRAESA